MLLTKTFAAETFSQALESWGWLDIAGKVPVLASLFGDVFMQDPTGYWFLDSLEGTITKVADSAGELQATLATAEGQDQYLLAGLAHAADRKGLILQATEVYDFSIPPILGGKTDLENVVVQDFVVALNIAGQIHDQVRSLPPGTPVKSITIDGGAP